MIATLTKITPEIALRVTLGIMYLYSGFSLFTDPKQWEWAVRALPDFMQSIIDSIGLNGFLMTQGVGEMTIGLIFLAWFLPKVVVKWAAILEGLFILSIIVLVGVDLVTFRDIGLFGALVALALLTKKDRLASSPFRS